MEEDLEADLAVEEVVEGKSNSKFLKFFKISYRGGSSSYNGGASSGGRGGFSSGGRGGFNN